MTNDYLLMCIMGGFLLAGLGLILGSLVSIFNTWRFIRQSIQVPGTVVTMVKPELHAPSLRYTYGSKPGGWGRRRHKHNPLAPQVKFTTQDGEDVIFTHSTASDPPAYKIGQKTSVRYHRYRPDQAQIDSFGSLWGVSLLMGSVGMVVTLVIGMILFS